jgi:hypothetical protein
MRLWNTVFSDFWPRGKGMKHFAGWQAVFLSFFSPDLYRDVVQNWRGVGFLYLFLLIALTWALQAVKLQNDVARFIDQYAVTTIQQFPKVRIEKGELSFDKPSPYYVKNTNGKPLIVFDTSNLSDLKNPETGKPLLPNAESLGPLEPPTVDYPDPLIIATKKEIIFWDGKQAKVNPLNGVDKVEVDQSTINSFVDAFRKWIGIVVYIVLVPMLFVIHIIWVLFYGLVAKIIANMMKIELNYAQLVRLSVIAITPTIVIDTVLRLLGAMSATTTGASTDVILIPSIGPLWPWIAVGITLIYLFFGLKANSQRVEDKVV